MASMFAINLSAIWKTTLIGFAEDWIKWFALAYIAD